MKVLQEEGEGLKWNVSLKIMKKKIFLIIITIII